MARKAAQDGLMGVLDVGSSKVACLVARRQMDGSYKVIGVGNTASKGVIAGQITDMDSVEQSIRQAVEKAEKMAGERLDLYTLALHCGDPASEVLTVEVDVDGQVVTEDDIESVMTLARQKATIDEDREIIHAFPAFYMIDGNFAPKAPIGMYGKKLSVNMHLITVLAAPLRNMELCVRKANIGIDGMIAGPYVSGLSTLYEDEIEMGAACIDIGGGTTTVSIFMQGTIVDVKVLPIGCNSLTETIARELLTPRDKAERLKNSEGGVIRAAIDDRVEIDVPIIGGKSDDSDARRMSRSHLTYLMQNHYEFLLREVKKHLDGTGFTESHAKRVIITGGASKAERLEDLAGSILGKNVRIASPALMAGLPISAQSPIFACCAGLLVYNELKPVDVTADSGRKKRLRKPARDGMFGKIGSWMKGNW
ncbi:cell division protein FtsA [Temperatibacter marinus]|uniref:Cell division protein FtsA n=1 Tax=Temperatibacter marinus TaxID=1456591 RepID=A0AA52H9G1_9PROT|nr:cell division protein FtsA [Temperatibacter marinus]WND01598.1 cell division protein FtsA [Temperatibacter marinus]